jgi:hypothetical protein
MVAARRWRRSAWRPSARSVRQLRPRSHAHRCERPPWPRSNRVPPSGGHCRVGHPTSRWWQRGGNTPPCTNRKTQGGETAEIGLSSPLSATGRNQPQTSRRPRNEGVSGSSPRVCWSMRAVDTVEPKPAITSSESGLMGSVWAFVSRKSRMCLAMPRNRAIVIRNFLKAYYRGLDGFETRHL